MRYSRQLAAAIESDLSCMIMGWVEDHFADEWCVDCPTAQNNACPEDYYDDRCPMHDQLENAKKVADDFAHIMMEAFN